MSHSQLFLGIALLCFSATLAFFISFRKQEHSQTEKLSITSPLARERTSSRNSRSSQLPLSDRKIRHSDPTNYEVSASDASLRELSERIEADSRSRLEKMTQKYQLSANQRRKIFPLLVSYHAEFQEGLIVNGSTASAPRGDHLASEIYPVLSPSQQEPYQEALLADNEWWGDIIGQLREDLDRALDAGELDLITEPLVPAPDEEK